MNNLKAPFLEDEVTFVIPADKIDSVLKTVAPGSEVINVDGTSIWIEDACITRSIHLFPSSDNSNKRERIKLSVDGKKISLKHQAKIYADGKKYEQTLETLKSRKKIARFLAQFDAIAGCVAKERLSLRYEFYDRGSSQQRASFIKVGIDRLLPFTPCMTFVGDVAYHIEFENGSEESLNWLRRSNYFREFSAPLRVLGTMDAKWRIASSRGGAPLKFCDFTVEALEDFVNSALSLLSPISINHSEARHVG